MSPPHGNTKKLVDAIAQRYGVQTATIAEAAGLDLKEYDRIGIAKGHPTQSEIDGAAQYFFCHWHAGRNWRAGRN